MKPAPPKPKTPPTAAPAPAQTLVRQQQDFTSEGSPPPGQVAAGKPPRTPPPQPQGPQGVGRRRWL